MIGELNAHITQLRRRIDCEQERINDLLTQETRLAHTSSGESGNNKIGDRGIQAAATTPTAIVQKWSLEAQSKTLDVPRRLGKGHHASFTRQ
eukprot:5108838-Karenia_brevis.AAC.1